jgi:hypothetical protein
MFYMGYWHQCIAAVLLCGSLSGCASYPNPVVRGDCFVDGRAKPLCMSMRWSDYEKGSMYCPVRYQIGLSDGDLSANAVRLAGKGYLYALAAAKVLHKDNEEGKDHLFADSEKIVHVVDMDESNWTGFQASVFEIRNESDSSVEKVVIAFRGSDQCRDWLMQNAGIPAQFSSARQYVIRVNKKYYGLPIIATGASLGGGLAAHVRQNEETAGLISEAWLFNPSIFDGVLFTKPDIKTYLIMSLHQPEARF